MYFTRFPVNMTRRQSRELLSSPYRIHAAIAGSFPPSESEIETEGCGRILWRLDHLENGGTVIYIVSPEIPSLIGLDEQIGWPDTPQQWATRDYQPFLDQINEGQVYSFRLVANPVVNRREIVNEQGDSKRIGHLTALHKTAWLIGEDAYIDAGLEIPELFRGRQSRASKNGFEVLKHAPTGNTDVLVSDTKKQTFNRGKSSGKVVTLVTARYDGMLRVSDANALKHALIEGIGHAKGFGCGLLTLATVRNKQ